MKIAYVDKLALNKANMARLNTINGIIDEYAADNYVMTLRQLYYQLVARDIIANNVKEYRKLSILLTKGRMAGVVDWAAIEDRGRQPRLPYWVHGIKDALSDTWAQYRLDRMKGQEYNIEVWVEKEALSNIFSRITNKYHVRLMVNKGYSSCSAMHDAYQRLEKDGRSVKIIYFGDHDPSGKDMVRDIEDRLQEFGLADFEILSPALSMQQIRQYKLPENPAKVTDPRAQDYIAQYGRHSWELDALDARVLARIIEDSILEHIDLDLYNNIVAEEKRQKNTIWSIMQKNDPNRDPEDVDEDEFNEDQDDDQDDE